MSKISVVVESPDNSARTVAAIRAITGLPVKEIVESIQGHRPLVEYLLWMNNHDSVADKLAKIIESLPTTGATVRFFLLEPNESLKDVGDSDHYEEISSADVEEMLVEFEDERRRQRNEMDAESEE